MTFLDSMKYLTGYINMSSSCLVRYSHWIIIDNWDWIDNFVTIRTFREVLHKNRKVIWLLKVIFCSWTKFYKYIVTSFFLSYCNLALMRTLWEHDSIPCRHYPGFASCVRPGRGLRRERKARAAFPFGLAIYVRSPCM